MNNRLNQKVLINQIPNSLFQRKIRMVKNQNNKIWEREKNLIKKRKEGTKKIKDQENQKMQLDKKLE